MIKTKLFDTKLGQKVEQKIKKVCSPLVSLLSFILLCIVKDILKIATNKNDLCQKGFGKRKRGEILNGIIGKKQ